MADNYVILGSTDLRILFSRRAVEDLNAQARERSRTTTDPESIAMQKQLTEAQERVLKWIGKGWRTEPGAGSAVMVNSKPGLQGRGSHRFGVRLKRDGYDFRRIRELAGPCHALRSQGFVRRRSG